MSRSARDWLTDIAEALADIRNFTADIDEATFIASAHADRKTFLAVTASLSQLGEAVKRLPDDIKTRHADIPWIAIGGMRDRLVHEYFRVDPEILWATIEEGELLALETVVIVEIRRLEE